MTKYDLVVFGATGFTGKFVARDLAKMKKENRSFTFAIAGRNASKLEDVVKFINEEVADAATIPVIIADVKNEPSMLKMCEQSKVLLNCTGPYRYFGSQTIKACLDAGSHYVDITGELDFIEQTMIDYHETAKSKGLVVVSACGWDSIPSELGVVFNSLQFPKEGAPSAVETYISVNNAQGGHYTTYECMIYIISDILAGNKHFEKLKNIPFAGPELRQRYLGYNSRIGKFYMPFIGADESLVKKTQEFLLEDTDSTGLLSKPVQAKMYLGLNFIEWAATLMFGAILIVFCSNSFGRGLMLKYPRLFTLGSFSHKGPSKKELEGATFTHTFIGRGFKGKERTEPDWETVTRVDGPEAGYVATPIMMIESAFTILNGEVKKGGVFTPAAAFRNTSLISSLNKRGVIFSVVSSGPIKKD